MYPRSEYEMTEADLKELLSAMKPVPAIMIGGHSLPSQQENANRAWATLGKKMGFEPMSVRPVPGKGNRFFTAVPSETEDQRIERLAKEKAAKDAAEIAKLEAEIADRERRIAAIRAAGITGE